MHGGLVDPQRVELDRYLEAYEAAQLRDGQADPAAFLPAPDHPLYGAVLRELVRIDMELGWERGRPHRLADYQRRFPGLARDRESLQAVAFIVPVYSVHRAGPLQAICMPYFGSTTLADVLQKLRGRAGLPDSGKALVQTLATHKSTKRQDDSEEKVEGGRRKKRMVLIHPSVFCLPPFRKAPARQPSWKRSAN